jgi:hypothetical protein
MLVNMKKTIPQRLKPRPFCCALMARLKPWPFKTVSFNGTAEGVPFQKSEFFRNL